MKKKIAASILSTIFLGLLTTAVNTVMDVKELKAKEAGKDQRLERIEGKVDEILFYLMEN